MQVHEDLSIASAKKAAVVASYARSLLALFNTTINSDVFFAWLTQDLLPKIPANTVLIMNNATFHKRADIIQMINNYGITLEYLPPYSPDLNLIEHKWAQAKAIRRRYRRSVQGCPIKIIFRKNQWVKNQLIGRMNQ